MMLGDITQAQNIYIACGYTDMRKSIDGLAAIVQQQFQLDPFSRNLFLFCGRKRDRIKALLWEGDGFVLLYKRLEGGCFNWPRRQNEAKQLTRQQFTWLLEGLSIEQPKAIAMWRTHWKKYISQVARENRSLVSFRNYIALGKTQDVSANKGVSLLTAHMSKGLQYEIVYVIGLNEGTFPDYRAIINGGKALEQEKNNMFVAVTRAKRICYLTFPDYKLMPWGNLKFQSKSRFIENVAVERAIL